MNIEHAFDDLQTEVNAPQLAVDKARARRDLFRDAFDGDDGVVERLPSGSLARGSQKDPIHDVDMIIVFDGDSFPDWGSPGSSAEDALRHTQARVKALLGENEGSFAKEVRRAHATGASDTARQALGFQELLAGDVERMKRRTRNYTRRQLTWMRKLAGVHVIDVTARDPDDIAREILDCAA